MEPLAVSVITDQHPPGMSPLRRLGMTGSDLPRRASDPVARSQLVSSPVESWRAVNDKRSAESATAAQCPGSAAPAAGRAVHEAMTVPRSLDECSHNGRQPGD